MKDGRRRSRAKLLSLLLLSSALTLLVACGGDNQRPQSKPGGALDAARFPVVLEADTRVVARSDGSGTNEEPVPYRPRAASAIGQGTASPDGRRTATYRDGKLFVQEGAGEPRAIVSVDSAAQYLSLLWSPDGSRIAYIVNPLSEPPSQRGQVYVVRADGSDLTLAGEGVFPGEGADFARWSPDGSRIAVLSKGVRVLSVTGAPPVDLGEGSSAHFSWSPDGRSLAFDLVYGDKPPKVVVADVRASEGARILTEGYLPRWSPAGDRIAFLRGTNVYTIRSDGSGLASLGDIGVGGCCPDLTWSADGASVEYIRAAPATQYLYGVDLRSGQKTRTPRALSDFGYGNFRYDVELSPDATQIAFVGSETYAPKQQKGGGESSTPGWLLMDVATGTVRQVTDEPFGDPYQGDVFWAPDGLRFAYSRGAAGVFIARADGSAPRRISALEARALAWSTDGARLAIAAGSAISVAAVEGTEHAEIDLGSLGVSEYVSDIKWSPDGTRLLYDMFGQDAQGRQTSRSFVAALDGSPPQELTISGEPARSGQWSPDGRLIGVPHGAAYFGDPVDIWLTDGRGNERKLTRIDDGSSWLYWSPDGTRIAVVSAPFGSSNVSVIDVTSGTTTLVATNVGNCGMVFAGWSPDSQVIYAVPKCALGGL